MGGPIEGGAEVVSWGPNRLDIFARLQDQSLYIKSWTGEVTGWIPSDVGWNPMGAPTGTTFASGHPSVTAWSPGTLQVVLPGSNGNVYLKRWTGTTWIPSQLGWDALGGPIVGSAKAVSWGANRLDIFARLTDGNLYIKSLVNNQWIPSQSGWNSLGAPPNASVASDPVVVSWGVGRLDILVMGTDGGLYLKSYDGDWIPQNTWASLGTCVGPVSMVSWGPNRLDIFARQGTDGALYIKSWTGATTGWIPSQLGWNSIDVPAPGIRITGPVTAVSWGVNELRVLAPASDGGLYERHWNAGWAPWGKLSDDVSQDRVETIPFWSTGVMYDESVLMVPPTSGGLPEAKLLFQATQILSVRDATLGIEYQRDKDWTFDSATNTLKLLNGSHAASMTQAQLFPSGGVLFEEGHLFHDKQLNVSYNHPVAVWTGPIPLRQTTNLQRSIAKLTAHTPLKLVLFGDSIAQGYSASGNETTGGLAAPPFMRSWGELIVRDLKDRYATVVNFSNKAVAGQDTVWGVNHVHNDVSLQNPDLVVLAFGMNDGTENMTPADFKAHVQAMMADVRASNPNAEFILVSPTLPNPASGFLGTQTLYSAQLASLVGPGVAFADMTLVHQKLLEKKKFSDLTGNGINHPNDFLVRWYAQIVGGLLL